ncbi:MAG: hydroxyacylglutathione hydrolase [Pseudomonadota bacterium]
MGLEIHRLPAFEDNYLWLLREPASGQVATVDPGDASVVLAALPRVGGRLDWILVTHHHPDHVGGISALKAATACRVAGPARDATRIPGLDIGVVEGDAVRLGAATAAVIETPGHTRGHIAWWFAADRALFCGDTLFSLGCGRLFEGDAVTMWTSLSKLAALPDDAQVHCAHEYTLSNARFAATVDPDHPPLRAFVAQVEALRARGAPTVPSRLGDEKACNPFLRAADPAFAARIGMAGAAPAAVFGELRRRKDVFR